MCMTVREMEIELEKHLAARAAVYSRFIVTEEKAILAEVSFHAAKVVELMAEIAKVRK